MKPFLKLHGKWGDLGEPYCPGDQVPDGCRIALTSRGGPYFMHTENGRSRFCAYRVEFRGWA